MGSALLRGWIQSEVPAMFSIIDPGGLPEEFTDAGPVIYKQNPAECLKAFQSADIIILAIKPQVMAETLKTLAMAISPQTLLISIAAGIPLSVYENHCGTDQPIIRAMPNTPGAIGEGLTACIPNAAVTDTQKQQTETLMQAAGLVQWLHEESLMNAVTAVSGSGPAYVFYFIEALAQAARSAGLPDDMADTLARQTVIGSAALAKSERDISAAALRENVTSPGGTTEAALTILMNGEIQEIYNKALRAAKQRGRDLSS